VLIIKLIIYNIISDETLKINIVITNTCFIMWKFYYKMVKRPAFSHVFYTLYDSYGL